jgi:hypothetical protein
VSTIPCVWTASADHMDEETLGARRYQRLVWALRWIAAEPEATLAALEFWLPPNEIALFLEDVLEIGPLTDVVPEPVAETVFAIDRSFEEMGADGSEQLWTAEAVRSAPEWTAQRQRARQVLLALHEPRDDSGLLTNV